MKHIVVVGATSDIAHETCRALIDELADPPAFLLLARDEDALGRVAADLRGRGAAVTTLVTPDLGRYDSVSEPLDQALLEFGAPDMALIAHGVLPEGGDGNRDASAVERIMAVNTTSHIALAAGFANRMLDSGGGVLAVISSVAGVRGRKSNYLYGASKAAVSSYLGGLRADVGDSVAVLDIRPGLVRSKMTAEMDSDGGLWADADKVGQSIAARMAKGDSGVAYIPGLWWPIMMVIRHLPHFVLKRLNI